MDDLLAYRDRFPILRDCTYLINHSLAAMPAAAEDNLLEYARMWRERGIRSWGEGWWEMPVTVGDQLGRIMGAPPGSIVMHQNVTVAEAIVLSCFSVAFGRAGRATGSSTRRRTSPRCATSTRPSRGSRWSPWRTTAAIVDAIDERTLLVPISHVLFRNAEIQDVEPIVARAHEVGAHVVLDCYQSAGIVPFDLAALGVDFAVGGSVKWLCGGPGAGWLYVRPDLAERLEPTLVGWQGHARPFAFEPELEYAAGARRFLTGTPNVPALYAATAGYDVIEEVGVERIRARSLAADAAPDRPLRRGRSRDREPARGGPPRRHRRSSGRPTTPASTASSASAGSSATSARTGRKGQAGSGSGRTSSPPRTSSATPSPSSRRSSRAAPTRGTAARPPGSESRPRGDLPTWRTPSAPTTRQS